MYNAGQARLPEIMGEFVVQHFGDLFQWKQQSLPPISGEGFYQAISQAMSSAGGLDGWVNDDLTLTSE